MKDNMDFADPSESAELQDDWEGVRALNSEPYEPSSLSDEGESPFS
jgi:hypothetical protein